MQPSNPCQSMLKLILPAAVLSLALARATVSLLQYGGDATVLSDASSPNFEDWPYFDDSWTRLELDQVDQAFLQSFPGSIGLFEDGQQQYLLRKIDHPTRKLHPASDCYKAMGYKSTPMPIHLDHEGKYWSCRALSRDSSRLELQERIQDLDGNAWTDVSAWYWNSVFGKSEGPWFAISVVSQDVQ